MDLANPAAPFLSANEARVLRALSRTTSGLTGRKVAALAAVPASTTRRILEGFTALGVVTATPIGPSYADAVNVEHVA